MREILYGLVYKMSPSFLKGKFWRKNKCNSNPFHNREYLENYSSGTRLLRVGPGLAQAPREIGIAAHHAESSAMS